MRKGLALYAKRSKFNIHTSLNHYKRLCSSLSLSSCFTCMFLFSFRALRNVDPFEPSSTLRSPNLASHLQTHALRNAPHRYRRDFGGPHNNNSGGGGNSSNSISSLDGTSGGMNEGLDVSNSIGSGSSGSFRPFQTLLLLRDESDVVAALPPDSSHQVFLTFL